MNAVAALLVAVCVSALSAVLLAFSFQGLNPAIAWIALGAGAVAGTLRLRDYLYKRKQPLTSGSGLWGWLTLLVFCLFSLRAFCWLVFQNGDRIEVLSPNNLGDLPLHLTYINNLANGVPFWPENPIFAGTALHYPLGVDLLNSLLTLAGLDVWRGLVWVGLAGCLLTAVALYRWGGTFALAGFLFNGGLAGFQFFTVWHFEDFQSELAWKSIPLAMFVTQRGLLYAVPAGLVLLWSWRARFFQNTDDDAEVALPFWVEVLLYSTMPLFHLHTFIFLSLLLGSWLCIGPERKRVISLIACSFVPATALIFWITGGFQSRSVIHLQPGWMQGNGNFFRFWLENFGVLPLLVIALCLHLVRRWREHRRALAFVLPSAAIFILTSFVMFAPWAWDNTKIMIWPYFVVLPFLWDQFLAKCNVWLRCGCCFALYFSGIVSLLGGIDGSHTGCEIASRSELDGIATAVRQTPTTAIFAAFPTYNHPLLLLGRKVVAGYPGHLMSHGIGYKNQIDQLESVLNGGGGWLRTARALHVRYIFWGNREKKAYPESLQSWKKCAAKIAEGAWGEIYDLHDCRAPQTGLQKSWPQYLSGTIADAMCNILMFSYLQPQHLLVIPRWGF